MMWNVATGYEKMYEKGRPPKQVVQLHSCLSAIVAYHGKIRTSISVAF